MILSKDASLNKRFFRGFLFTFITLFVLFGIISSGLFILFETKKGQNFLLEQTHSYLKKQGFDVSLEGLHGDFPKNFNLQKMTLTFAPERHILILENLKIHFKWSDLLKGILTLETLEAEKISFLESSAPSTEDPTFKIEDLKSYFNALSLPSLPFSLNINRIYVQDLSFSNKDQTMHFEACGKCILPHFLQESESSIFLNIKGLNIPSSFSLEAYYEDQEACLKGMFYFKDEKNGFLKLGQPLNLKGSFEKKNISPFITGDLTLQSTSSFSSEISYCLNYEEPLTLSLKGDVVLYDLLREIPVPLSSSISITAEISAKENSLLIHDAKLENDQISFITKGEISLSNQDSLLQGKIQILTSDLVGGAMPTSLQGLFQEKTPREFLFELAGNPRDQITFDLSAKKNDKEGGLHVLGNFNATDQRTEADVFLDVPFKNIVLESNAHLLWQNNKLQVSSLQIKGPLITLEGDITWHLSDVPEGNLNFSFEDLDRIGLELPKGSLTGSIKFHPSRGLSIILEGQDLQYDEFSLESLSLKGISKNFKGEEVKLSFICQNFHKDNILLFETFKTTLKGNLAQENAPLKGRLSLENSEGDFHLTTNVSFFQTNALSSLSFESFKGRFQDLWITLRKPLKILFSQNNLSLKETILYFRKSSLSLAFEKKNEALQGRLFLKNFSFSSLNSLSPFLNLPLTLKGEALLKGTTSHPLLTVDASLKPVKQLLLFEAPVKNFHGHFSGSWNGQNLKVRLEAQDDNLKNILHVNGTLPLVLDNKQHIFLSTRQPLTFSITGNGYLETLSPFLLPFLVADGDLLKGKLELSLKLDGNLSQKHLSGFLSLQEGEYQNLSFGTNLKNINLKIQGKGDRLQIIQGKAHDKQNGEIHLEGSCAQTFSEKGPKSYMLKAYLKDFHPVSLDLVTMSATGILNLFKDPLSQMPSLKGELTLSPISVHIPKKLPSSIVVLPFTREGDLEEAYKEGRQKANLFLKKAQKETLQNLSIIPLFPPPHDTRGTSETLTPEIPLDIDLTIPSKFTVEGRGLTSSWKGNVAIGGTLKTPLLKGQLFLIRGEYILFGKTFLLKKGNLFFTRDSTIDPALNITAQITTADIIAEVLITGRLTTPQFTLKSQPSLPPSEIASRVLFGKSIGALTPFQSLQIASALADLTGTSSPLSFVDEIRNSLGLGGLSFTSGSGGPGLNLGKFLSDNVSLNVSPDLATNTAQASVEVKVLPNITLQSDINTQTDGGIGVNWQWDYD